VATNSSPIELTEFTQTNLISDGSVPAANIDPNLINPWGVSFSPTGPFWVSDNGAGVATIYNSSGTPVPAAGNTTITIATPPGQTTPASPTGQVFNSAGSGFNISSGGVTAPAVFIFATEDGTISGWNPSVNAGSSVLAVDNSAGGTGAVYKGLTMASNGGSNFLYAANFRNGTVDVFDQNFNQVNSFTDPTVPAGFAPFDVQNIDGNIYVTFALQDGAKHDDVAGPGNGFVDEFDPSGHLLMRVASGGVLNSPWGLDIAPPSFGQFAGDLLVGNFGDGTINAFNPTTGAFVGQLLDTNGNPIKLGDLWALINGNDGSAGSSNSVFFTAGVQDEAHGLFGSLSPALTTTFPGSGNNLLALGSGSSVVGSTGTDTIVAGSGDATIGVLANNSDLVFGGSGKLLFINGGAPSTVVGGAGSDTILGGAGGGVFSGGQAGNNVIVAGTGPTTIFGGGTSTVVGGAGSETIFGGAGGGIFAGGHAGSNAIVAGAGPTTIFGGGSGDELFANGASADVIAAGAGNETLSGGSGTGANVFFAGSGNDIIGGGSGNETFVGGTGNATIFGGSGADFYGFINGQSSGGTDLIVNFDSAKGDAVVLSGYGPSELANALAGATTSAAGVTITLSDHTAITFTGLSQLTSSDFTS
jgi:uncharacterized protein (TIGR03118 family)